MIDPTIVQHLQDSADWQAVQDHILEAIGSLDRSSDIDTSDDRACAIEVAARNLAVQKLRAILEPFAIAQQPAAIVDVIREKENDTGIS